MSTGVPEKEPLLQNGEKHKVTFHGAPRGHKAYIEWGAALFPKGIVNDPAITTPVSCSLQHGTFHFFNVLANMAWVDHSPISQYSKKTQKIF
jgi:hypothetical protein